MVIKLTIYFIENSGKINTYENSVDLALLILIPSSLFLSIFL